MYRMETKQSMVRVVTGILNISEKRKEKKLKRNRKRENGCWRRQTKRMNLLWMNLAGGVRTRHAVNND